MPRHEGSRNHEYAIQTACQNLNQEGWATIRPRNTNLPLLAVTDHALHIIGHAAHDWPPRENIPASRSGPAKFVVTIDAVGKPTDHDEARAADMSRFFAAIMRDLEERERSLRREGCRVVRLWRRTSKGFLSVIQPDAVAVLDRRILAIEATTGSPHHHAKRYPDFDGVLIARFRANQVYDAEEPPKVALVYHGAGARP